MARSRETDPREAAARAALDLAAGARWSDLRLSDIATAAKVSLTDLYPMTGADALVPEAERLFDRAMSAEAASKDDTPRERLFDVIMRRFEAMEDHRPGCESLLAHVLDSPVRRTAALIRRGETARWALVCAGLEGGEGPLSDRARQLGLALVIQQTESAWRKETSGDFALTMAKLDKGLRELDERMETLRNPLDAFRAGRKPPSGTGDPEKTTHRDPDPAT